MKCVASPCCSGAPWAGKQGSSCCAVVTAGLQWVPAGMGRWGAPRERERTPGEVATAGPDLQPSQGGSTGRLA